MQTNVSTFTISTPGGPDVFVRHWDPAGAARAVVAIAHGAAEHGARYEHFAQTLNASGYAVYASDHRGHGETAAGKPGVVGDDAWNGTVRDFAAVIRRAQSEHPGVPVFLFGHSMGSVLAQRFIQLHGGELAGVILSGSLSGVAGFDAILAMADAAASGGAPDQPSELFAQMFAGFNAPFEQRTGFEWLTRDEREVRKYVDDPLCGFPFSNRMLADFLHGWADAWNPANDGGVPKTLPMLIFSGAVDPVGENTVSVNALADRYRAHGLQDVHVTFYPDARHEMLNEINRDEVERDVVAWLDGHLPA